MMCTKNIAKSEFIFSQYSRKGYSIFSSLGIIIKIGTLGVELCNHGFTKCEQFIDSLIFQLTSWELIEETDPKDSDLFNEDLLITIPVLKTSPFCDINLFSIIKKCACQILFGNDRFFYVK